MPNPLRTYDSTLARIAGNIASGFAARLDMDPNQGDLVEHLAIEAVRIAQAIIEEAKRVYREQQEAEAQRYTAPKPPTVREGLGLEGTRPYAV